MSTLCSQVSTLYTLYCGLWFLGVNSSRICVDPSCFYSSAFVFCFYELALRNNESTLDHSFFKFWPLTIFVNSYSLCIDSLSFSSKFLATVFMCRLLKTISRLSCNSQIQVLHTVLKCRLFKFMCRPFHSTDSNLYLLSSSVDST